MKTVHNLKDTIVDANSIGQFVKLLYLVPSKKFLWQNRKIINEHVKNGKDMPSNVYKKLEKCFQNYKKNKGVKIVVQVASQRQSRRQSASRKQKT